MSADNWTYCPKCAEDSVFAKNRALDNLRANYGKFTFDEFVRQQKNIEDSFDDEDLERTLREDYEFSYEDSILVISYSCCCTECRFSWSIKRKFDVIKNEEIECSERNRS